MFQRNSSSFTAAAASIFVAAACLFAGSGPALAGAGAMSTTVETLQPNVTYSGNGSTPLLTYVAYKVTIVNTGGNTINNIRFTGATAVIDPAEQAVYASVDGEGASCKTTNTAGTAIECTIGQLKAGKGFPSFVLFFSAPAKVINGVADGTGEDSVAFSGTTFYAEGSGGVPQSTPPNSTEAWAAAAVALGTFNPTLVKTAVQKTGGALWTGNGNSANSADPFATSVTVPVAATYTTAQIEEAPLVGEPNCNSFGVCWQTSLTIPGTFTPYLTIVLTMDKSNIKSGTKIETVVIDYVDSSNVLWPIGLCASETTPDLAPPYVPCIAKRVYFKNRSVDGWTPDLDGDFRWELISKNNGSVRFR